MQFDLILGAGIAMLATSLGALGVLAFKHIEKRVYPLLLSFSAGVMIYSACEMLLESHSIAGYGTAITGLASGLFLFFIIEKILPHAHMLMRKKKLNNSKKRALLLAGTITLHNIPEGFAIASAFAGSAQLGWLVTTSIALQDIPEGFIVSAPLASYGIKTKHSVFWGIFSGVAEFGAAIVGYVFLSTVNAATPFALAFASGAMVYVSIFEIIAENFRLDKDRQLTAATFVAGIMVAYAFAIVLGIAK